MPNKQRRGSVVEMLAKVPVAKGSLLVGIENLLKTIESSENGVMIPTLLRDKCDFDAWELLFVAKILKASILGHVDLVEFYMNHIGMNSAQFTAAAQGLGTPITPTPTPTAGSVPATNGAQGLQVSSSSATTTPTTTPHSPAASLNGIHMPAASPSLSPGGIQMGAEEHQNGSQPPTQEATTTNGNLLSLSSSSGSSTGQGQLSARSQLSSSSVSWASAQQTAPGQLPSPGGPSSGDSSPAGSTSGSSLGLSPVASVADQLAALPSTTARATRQAQPPSLLQLTTTNNHINHQLSVSTSGAGSHSISNGHAAAAVLVSMARQQPPTELRHSRSAGCLFRLNSSHSGASSPRTPLANTPATPYPQAETLAQGLQSKGLAGDSSAPLKLLLQIEQLKQSISHVTSQLESVMELYKKSIDSIALA